MKTNISVQAKKQQGFTLIELIVVIVILGILAATALPKFVDLSAEAEQATAEGVAGAIASSAVINFSANKADSVTYPYVRADACSGNYLEGGIPADCDTTTVAFADPVCTVSCGTAGVKAITLP